MLEITLITDPDVDLALIRINIYLKSKPPDPSNSPEEYKAIRERCNNRLLRTVVLMNRSSKLIETGFVRTTLSEVELMFESGVKRILKPPALCLLQALESTTPIFISLP
jgi:hypothetical protein